MSSLPSPFQNIPSQISDVDRIVYLTEKQLQDKIDQRRQEGALSRDHYFRVQVCVSTQEELQQLEIKLNEMASAFPEAFPIGILETDFDYPGEGYGGEYVVCIQTPENSLTQHNTPVRRIPDAEAAYAKGYAQSQGVVSDILDYFRHELDTGLTFRMNQKRQTPERYSYIRYIILELTDDDQPEELANRLEQLLQNYPFCERDEVKVELNPIGEAYEFKVRATFYITPDSQMPGPNDDFPEI